MPVELLTKPIVAQAMRRFEYKVIDTGKRVEEELNELGAEGWRVVGAKTKKQLLGNARREDKDRQRPVAVGSPEHELTCRSRRLTRSAARRGHCSPR
jgi:hypothetical protein